MKTSQSPELYSLIAKLTGSELPSPSMIRGRNVWGRIAFNRPGMLHLELKPLDREVIAASKTSDGGYLTPGQQKPIADAINQKIVQENRLILLMAANGYATRETKILADALL